MRASLLGCLALFTLTAASAAAEEGKGVVPSTKAGPPAAASATPAASPAATPAAGPEDAALDGRRLLLDCEKQFLRLTSMKGTIRDRAVHHEIAARGKPSEHPVQETESDFVYKRFDRIRFENLLPVPHSVIWNGEKLWIWSPQENAVVEERAEDVPLTARAGLSVQPGFGIDLLAPIPLDAYAVEVKRIVGTTGVSQTVVTLTPMDKDVPRATMRLVVDPEKRVVTRIAASVGEDIQVSDVQLSEFVEAVPGIWFATRVHSRTLLGDGTQLEQLRSFERMKFNVPVEDSKFEFRAPEGAKVVPLSNLKQGG